MKIVTVLGARPQFVKAAAVSRMFKNYPKLKEVIIHTGQHYDFNMSESFFIDLDIPLPNYQLALNGSSHGAMTAGILEKTEAILLTEKPDLVLVYGDTNSTLAGALAASKLKIPIAHIEAGLRSFNMNMPEEINRILTDRISKWLFCPTSVAINNLKKEGYSNFDCKIIESGDVMQDAAMYYSAISDKKSKIISDLNVAKDSFVLATLHRAENTDTEENLINIIIGLNEINKSTQVVLPLHPRTKKIIEQFKITPHFTIIDPVGYFDMIALLKNCQAVATDSGGLQKEAFFFEKPCITFRDETEWTELVENNYNKITGPDSNKIVHAFYNLNTYNTDYSKNLYGNGNACRIIAESLLLI